jgi:hypothetical protein
LKGERERERDEAAASHIAFLRAQSIRASLFTKFHSNCSNLVISKNQPWKWPPPELLYCSVAAPWWILGIREPQPRLLVLSSKEEST